MGSRASLDRSPRKNWVEQSGSLPGFVRELARAIEKRGVPLDRAIAIALSRVKLWASGGGGVNADTRAKATRAWAQWLALRAKNKARKVETSHTRTGMELASANTSTDGVRVTVRHPAPKPLPKPNSIRTVRDLRIALAAVEKIPAGKRRQGRARIVAAAVRLGAVDALPVSWRPLARSGMKLANSRSRQVIELAGKSIDDVRKTGGMVALIARDTDAAKLVVDGGEPASELHLTLQYLGSDVTGWDQQRRADLVKNTQEAAAGLAGDIHANVWAHATFNPAGDQCATYLVGAATIPALDAREAAERARDAARYGHTPDPDLVAIRKQRDHLGDLHEDLTWRARRVLGDLHQAQHAPFIPHITAKWGGAAADLTFTGPVVFDRVLIVLAGQRIEFPLTPEEAAA